MTNEMSLSFSATLENEPFVRTCIASFVVCLNPTVDEIVEIKTVVGEAVSNAIIHGYNGDKRLIFVKVKAYESKMICLQSMSLIKDKVFKILKKQDNRCLLLKKN